MLIHQSQLFEVGVGVGGNTLGLYTSGSIQKYISDQIVNET